MQGLIGMQQPQQQANLLGNVFQSQAQSRQQGRNRLLGEALQIGLAQDPIRTGFAAVGGLLGQATGRAMGRITPEEAQQQKAAMIRRRIDERGISLAENPYEYMLAGAEVAQEMGDMQTTMALLQRAQEFRPEPVETPAAVRTLAFRAQQAGLQPGTPEYRQFMASGGSPQRDDLTVGSSARYINKNTDETTTLVRTNRGLAEQTVDDQGNPDFRFVNSANYERVGARETGGPGGFGSGDFSDLGEIRNVTIYFANQAQRLQQELRAGTIGIPGAIARFSESAGSQIQGVFEEAFGIGIEPSARNSSAYADKFEELGLAEASAETKSALTDLAITKAYLDQRGGGDVRKNEVERAFETLRLGSGSSDQIAAALGRTVESAIDRFNISRETSMLAAGEGVRMPFDPLTREQFGLGDQGQRDPMLTVESIENLSLEELRSLNPDEIPNDPQILQALDNRINQLEGNARSTRQRGGGAQ